MNYIDVIKAVWKWYQSSILEPNDYCLMMRLIAISNDDMGWEDCFLRNNYELIGSTKLSYKQLHHSRNKLQQLGLISFNQRNGNPNCRYEIDFEALLKLSKKSKAEGKVTARLGKGEGVDKLNKTKLNNSFSDGDPPEPKKEKEVLAYWKEFVEKFDEFYLEKFKSKYNYLEKDFAALKKIYKFLKNRAAAKNSEFTEPLLLESLIFFLSKAWEKDDWLKQNFTISNCLGQFNQIVNGNNTQKPSTSSQKGGTIDDLQSLKRTPATEAN